MSQILAFTAPRETSARWTRRGDQVAFFATHYAGTASVPVRTTELAAIGGPGSIVCWRTLMQGPVLVPGAAGRHILTIMAVDTTGDVEDVMLGEHEQIVIREQVTVEPWDVVGRALRQECGAYVDGFCCLILGHPGDHDPEPTDHPDARVQDSAEFWALANLAAPTDPWGSV